MSNFDLSSFVKLALSYIIHITNVKNLEKCENSQKTPTCFRMLKGALANNAIDLQ